MLMVESSRATRVPETAAAESLSPRSQQPRLQETRFQETRFQETRLRSPVSPENCRSPVRTRGRRAST
ncbi:hypothetical protein IQ62_05585 [Streptomyces scabiei]|nr:hypothetical protein IQ62_05585 [Streptomyces scabiei]